MKEMNFKEFVEVTVRRYELLSGPVDIEGEIDQFKPFTITIHGRKGDKTYTGEDLEAYYMSELDKNVGPEALRAVY